MGTFENTLARLNALKRDSVETQVWTQAYEVWVPNSGYHFPNEFPPPPAFPVGKEPFWPGMVAPPAYPGNTPGKATLLVRCEEDAQFFIEKVTMSVYGPVRWGGFAKNRYEPVPATWNGLPSGTLYPLPALSNFGTLSFVPADVNIVNETIIVGTSVFTGWQIVYFRKTVGDTLPAPLLPDTMYWATPETGSGAPGIRCHLSNTFGGPTINLTSIGANPSGDPFQLLILSATAERGVSIRVTDQSAIDRPLIDTFTPAELLFPPAYGVHIPMPWNLEYVLQKQHQLKIEFYNRDESARVDSGDEGEVNPVDDFHVCGISFTGRKFYS